MESRSPAIFLLAFGFSRARFVLYGPWCLRAVSPSVVGPFTAALRQRGIVSDWRFMGKRKVYEGNEALAHSMHNFSTSTEFVQLAAILPLRLLFSPQSANRRKFFRRRNSLRYRTNNFRLWKRIQFKK